jgi:hypothetical protein
MFISNTERIQLRKDLDQMSKLFNDMNNDMIYLIARIKVLEGEKNPPKRKRTMTPEGKAKMSQMMKDRHAKKKLEEQNASSISTTGQ